MPKVKTRRCAAKRFSLTGKGKIKRAKAYSSHLLTHKNTKRKRSLRKNTLVAEVDAPAVRRMLNV